MRLYRIHLPLSTVCNSSVYNEAHAALAADLLRSFGGFTSWDGVGAWLDDADGRTYKEPVRVYEVAANAADVRIKAAALEAGRTLKEKAVYIVCDGVAEIVRVEEEAS